MSIHRRNIRDERVCTTGSSWSSNNEKRLECDEVQKASRGGGILPRLAVTAVTTIILAPLIPSVLAQAPVNDIVSWPSGVLLLATILYAALGTAPDTLWAVEPSIGLFMASGLPVISIPTMQRVTWVTKACHFVPGIRSAHGMSNFWVRTEQISKEARDEALKITMEHLSPVIYESPHYDIDKSIWDITPAGLLVTLDSTSQLKPSPASPKPSSTPSPTAREFLLFSAIHYHAFWEWEVQIIQKSELVFTTKGTDMQAIFDVDSEDMALAVVAAQMVRRPHSQSPLREMALHQGDHPYGPYILNLDSVRRDVPAFSVDFHSYAADSSKVSATLTELASAYYHVIQYVKHSAESRVSVPETELPPIAHIQVGQTLWLAILGGAILDTGRLTIQNLPGKWSLKGFSADEAYLTRITAILDIIHEKANTAAFDDIVFSGGSSRRPAVPFLLAGLFGQILVCYFLSVGTSAGIWTSVALANTLYAGKLLDWHSLYYGKTLRTQEPGMKMYIPGTQDLMAIATFDRTSPRQGDLRPGFLLNALGLIGAILGSIFQEQTRSTLGFAAFEPSRRWVVYTSVVLAPGLSLLIGLTLLSQQLRERTWFHDSELPTRWMVYATLPCSVIVAALAAFFQARNHQKLWPVLDAITWVSGLPFGMLENGRMVAADDNVMHLLLVNRWLMGAVASALGSSIR